MLAVIAELLLSWLLLWLIHRQNLTAIGVVPTVSRLVDYFAGLCMSVFCCTSYHLLSAALAGDAWIINENILITELGASVLWVSTFVHSEILIFDGALLYIAIRKWGTMRACMLSAACFGVYHWFSYNVVGNPVQMGIVFFMAAWAGLMFAFAFVKTGSFYLPLALHLGWNYTNIIVFSQGSLRDQLLVRQNDLPLEGLPSLLLFLFQLVGLPLATYVYLKVSGKMHSPTTQT